MQIKQFEPDEQTELAALETIKLEPTDITEQLPADVCSAFSKLQTFAREYDYILLYVSTISQGQYSDSHSWNCFHWS